MGSVNRAKSSDSGIGGKGQDAWIATQQLASQTLIHPRLATFYGGTEGDTLLRALRGFAPSSDERLWVPTKQLQLMMSLAVCTALSFCAPEGSLKDLRSVFDTSADWVTAQQDLVHMAVHLGARLPKLVVASRAPTGGDSTLMDLALRRDHTARQLLISVIHLEAHNVTDDLSASYLAWEDCVKPLPLADLPSQLLGPRAGGSAHARPLPSTQ